MHHIDQSDELDHVQPARPALHFRKIGRRKSQPRGNVALLETRAFTDPRQHIPEDHQLVREFCLRRDAILPTGSTHALNGHADGIVQEGLTGRNVATSKTCQNAEVRIQK